MSRIATPSASWLALTLLLGVGSPLAAQTADARRPQATRAELEAALEELERVIGSSGYSKSFRQARESEAKLVKQRLSEGDFQVGDQITIAVYGEATLTNTFQVLPGRVLSLPNIPPVKLDGVLRSEIGDHLTEVIGRYVKDPQVTIQGSMIRLAILGAVGKPGYYTMQADLLVADAIMQAGGPSANIDMDKSQVRRQGEEVITGEEIQRAIEAGLSLDQLNLHGGDELVLGGGGGNNNNPGGRGGGFRNWFWPIQAAVSLGFLLTRIF